jgi:hypothetical protein
MTTETKCDMLDLNLSTNGYYPTPAKCDVKASKFHGSNMQIIAFRANDTNKEDEFVKASSVSELDTKTFIAGIHNIGGEPMPYSLWALASAKPPNSEAIDSVSKTIYTLRELSKNSPEDLWRNMPKLHREAHEKSNAAHAKPQYSTPASPNKLGSGSTSPVTVPSRSKRGSPATIPPPAFSPSSMDRPISQPGGRGGSRNRARTASDATADMSEAEEDMAVMEKFIAKSGRAKLRRELEAHRSMSKSLSNSSLPSQTRPFNSRITTPVNPNMHMDLFSPSVITDLDRESLIDDLDDEVGPGSSSTSVDMKRAPSFEERVLQMPGFSALQYAFTPDDGEYEDMGDRNAEQDEEVQMEAHESAPHLPAVTTPPTGAAPKQMGLSESLPSLISRQQTGKSTVSKATSLGDLTVSNYTQFPFLGTTSIGHTGYPRPQPKKLIKFNDPKPIKYTVRKL